MKKRKNIKKNGRRVAQRRKGRDKESLWKNGVRSHATWRMECSKMSGVELPLEV